MKNIILNHKNISLCIFALVFVLLFFLIREFTYIRVKAEFDNLRPFHNKADVFYKGYKVGHVVSIIPANHYKTTIVTLALHPKNTKFPSNMEAKLKVHKTRWQHKDYVDLIYPLEPANDYLKNGSVIKGSSSMSYEAYLASVSEDTYLKMEENVKNTLENLEGSTGLLLSILAILEEMMEESKPNIQKSLKNLSKTTSSTSQLVEKINSSIEQNELNSSVDDILQTTKNINSISSSLSNTAMEIDKSMPTAVEDINSIVKNVDEITTGLTCTLKKHFGGFRLLFGKSIY